MRIPKPTARRGGFTLVELLVALTIFSIVSTMIAVAYLSGIRITDSIRQTRDSLEEARAAMSFLERDLRRTMTARHRGDYYHLYGSNYGLMLSGNVLESDSGGDPNLGRITYVVYTGYNPQTDGFGTNAFEDIDSNLHVTFSLLRYVEPGIDDLDTYTVPYTGGPPGVGDAPRFDWRVLAGLGQLGDPGSPDEARADFLRAELDRALGIPYVGPASVETVRRENPERYQHFKARQRELYMRMLGGDPSLPDIWAYFNAVAGRSGFNVLSPQDFILVDNIDLRVSTEGLDALNTWINNAPHQSAVDPGTGYGPYPALAGRTAFGLWAPDGNGGAVLRSFREFADEAWQMAEVLRDLRSELYRLYETGSPNQGAIDVMLAAIPQAEQTARRLRVFEYGQAGLQRDPLLGLASDVLSSMPTTLYWNDVRNEPPPERFDVAGLGFNERDPLRTERSVFRFENEPMGSPLNPRLPALVRFEAVFFVPATTVGGADLRRVYEKSIAIPAGYVRAI